MNDKILEFVIKENKAWDGMITRQSKEIPELEEMFWGIINLKKVWGSEFNITMDTLREGIWNKGFSMTCIK